MYVYYTELYQRCSCKIKVVKWYTLSSIGKQCSVLLAKKINLQFTSCVQFLHVILMIYVRVAHSQGQSHEDEMY